jgi:hypothetical protein
VFGYLGIAVADSSPWLELTAILFGIGMGLTMDEFALWLNLQDVYWQQKGRQSIDAVIVTTCLLVITLLGLQFWIDVYQALLLALGLGGERLTGEESRRLLVPLQLAGTALAFVCFFKDRVLFGLVGLFVPLVALIGALRLGKPDSRWARRFYDDEKKAKARERHRDKAAAAASPPAQPPARSTA